MQCSQRSICSSAIEVPRKTRSDLAQAIGEVRPNFRLNPDVWQAILKTPVGRSSPTALSTASVRRLGNQTEMAERPYIKPSLLLGFLLALQLCVHPSAAIGLQLGACADEVFKCQCGPNPGKIIEVPVPQCTFVYRWEFYCHACKNGNRIKEGDVCPKYQRCQECETGGASCSVCPQGKFGTWCEKTESSSGGSGGLLDLNLSLGLLGGGGKKTTTAAPVPACQCLNGGSCRGFSDHCTCPPAYRGIYCETFAGCPRPPPPTPPLSAVHIPEDRPLYVEYSCPRTGYLLEGSSRLTCNTTTRNWSHQPPTCQPSCQIPFPPANGKLVNVSLETGSIKNGQSVNFECIQDFALIGATSTTCKQDRTWTHPTPFCTKAKFCPEPSPVPHATSQLKIPPYQPPFTEGTDILYSCHEEYLLSGDNKITCEPEGYWSSDGPTCVKVFDSEVDCETAGAEVVDEVGTPVRIHCPAGCSQSNGSLLGTVIYEETSSVCQAAVHAGRINTALGGSLFVVNNGPYNDFLGSSLNGITSQRKEDMSNSFRFQRDSGLETQNRDDPDKGCPQGWLGIEGHCVYVVPKKRAWDVAKGICANMGSRLPQLSDQAFLNEVLKTVNQRTDLASFWILNRSNNSEEFHILWEQDDDGDLQVNSNITFWEEDEGFNASCALLTDLATSPRWRSVSCEEESPFICDINLKELQVTCGDRGELENGNVLLQDPPRGLRRGAIINYVCQKLHLLKGEAISTCQQDGTWSTSKPNCIRVPSCEDPPSVKFGSYEILPPAAPLPNSRLGRPGSGNRHSRLGVPLPRPKRSTAANDTEVQELPPGHHRVGARAQYNCQSRYYDLVGSQTRRCQEDGSWSGRPATCLPICGRSDSPRTPFITNGNSTDIGQWPWLVAISQFLSDYKTNFILCGGALINEQWVLTAAHCVTDETTHDILPLENFQLYAGKYHRDDSLDDGFVQPRKAVEIHVHPDYDHTVYDADIALVRMDSYVTLTTRVQPVCLPTDKSTRQNLVHGKRGVVVGWGLTESAEYASSLRQAVLPVVSHEKCEEGYEKAKMPLTVSENMFCAGLEEGNSDACSGDSGGPMVFQADTKFWFLEGIVSWGSPTGCGNPNQYGGFTKVNRFLEWINMYI